MGCLKGRTSKDISCDHTVEPVIQPELSAATSIDSIKGICRQNQNHTALLLQWDSSALPTEG